MNENIKEIVNLSGKLGKYEEEKGESNKAIYNFSCLKCSRVYDRIPPDACINDGCSGREFKKHCKKEKYYCSD